MSAVAHQIWRVVLVEIHDCAPRQHIYPVRATDANKEEALRLARIEFRNDYGRVREMGITEATATLVEHDV